MGRKKHIEDLQPVSFYSGKSKSNKGRVILHSFAVQISERVWVRMPIPLVVFLSITILYNLGIIGLMFWTNALNFKHYTYWNYILVTIFDIIYLSSCFTSPGVLFKWMNLLVFPIVIGSTAIVNILILVILQNNDWIMVSASVFGEGQLPLGKIHLVDYLIHSWPILSRFLCLILGQLDILRHYVYGYTAGYVRIFWLWFSTPRDRKIAYFFYWMLSPLVPIAIYSSINNPFIEYPTNFSFIEGTMILLLITFASQLITFFSVYTSMEICTNCGMEIPHFLVHFECPEIAGGSFRDP